MTKQFAILILCSSLFQLYASQNSTARLPESVIEALEKGNEQAAIDFFKQNPHCLEAECNFFLRTPLIAAAFYGRPAVVHHLLTEKAHVNTTNCWKQNALTVMLRNARSIDNDRLMPIIAMLSKMGIDMNQVDSDGKTALNYAARSFCSTHVVGSLLQHGSSTKTCKYLLFDCFSHCEPHAQDELEVMGLLAKHGANPSELNQQGKTLLDVAQNENNFCPSYRKRIEFITKMTQWHLLSSHGHKSDKNSRA